MADVETPNNRATPANDTPDSFTNRSAISERTRYHGNVIKLLK